MDEGFKTPTTVMNVEDDSTPELQNHFNGETTVLAESNMYPDGIDSTCATPYVSALLSSPGRGGCGGGFFFSAPASPMHPGLCSSSLNSTPPVSDSAMSASFEFEFSGRFGTIGLASTGSMSSADELFLNGQIRPMKLSTHLQRPQVLAPLLDLEDTEADCEAVMDEAEMFPRGRDVKWRNRSLHRRTRSMSPFRTPFFEWHESDEDEQKTKNKQSVLAFESLGSKQIEAASTEMTPSSSASSSRSSSASRSSKRWEFLKDFLYRSKSEGRNNGHKFWSSISFSPVKDRKASTRPPISPSNNATATATTTARATAESPTEMKKKMKQSVKEQSKKGTARKALNGVGRRRVPPSPHELHYTVNRAQAEEMRKKTFLPYKQGLFGCLSFSSKSYGAMNGFVKALNPVSSR